MNKTRIYISGPISGTDDYKERFAKAEKELTEQGYSVINPAKLADVLPEDFDYDDFIRIDIALINSCDAVYMLKGWKESSGANFECGYALALDKMVLYEGETNE